LRRISSSNFSQRQTKIKKNFSVAKNNSERWSRTPIDFTYLNSFDSDVELAARNVIYDKLRLAQIKLKASLREGKLKIHEATGNTFGGNLVVNGILNAKTKRSQIETQFSLNSLNLPSALQSFQDRTLSSGTMDFSGNFRTKGQNVADLVSHLNGVGSVSLKNLGVSSSTQTNAGFAGITSLLASLNQFAATVGGRTNLAKANVQGRFRIVNGIAEFNNTTLTSGMGNGIAKGLIDLNSWKLNSTGSLNISQNILMQMLMKENAPKSIPFQISGLLDKPNVKLDTSGFSIKRIRIPGKIGKKLGRVLEKKGIGSVLQEILPLPKSNSNSTPKSSKHSSSPNTDKQQKRSRQPLKPEDVLKGLLRGLTQ